MNRKERDKLRELALAATQGEREWIRDSFHGGWHGLYTADGDAILAPSCCNDGDTGAAWFSDEGGDDIELRQGDRDFFTALTPATLLALLDRIDEIEGITPTERAVPEITGDTSDGYHTFNELYEFRKVYNAALFNEWAAAGKYNVHKSWRHHDGEDCFGGGWFIVVAVLPTGQISNHYAAEDWGLFNVPECERAKFEFDGHTSEDVLLRLKTLAAAPGAGGAE